MNKPELAARVAGRLSLSGSEANRAIEVLFDVIAQTLADGKTVRVSGVRHVPDTRACGAEGTQPAHGRAHRDRRVHIAGVQGRQIASRRPCVSPVRATARA